jgi:hypothetical protein
MGRPLNKRNFKDVDGITVAFGSTGAAGWIVKQLGSKEFRCAAVGNDGTTYEDCKLVDSLANADNECSIAVDSQFVKKITGRRLVGTDGTVYTWDILGASGNENLDLD